MVRRWFVVVVCALGCGGKARPKPVGPEYLGAVRIEGNTALPDDELIPKLGLHRALASGRAIDPYTLTLDNQRISAAYLRHGYFDVTVTSHVAKRQRGTTVEQIAVFAVTEGKRSRIRVVFTGLPPDVPEERARALIPIPDGAPFDYELYDAAKQRLVALLESAGYAHVQLDAAVIANRESGEATARYAFEPGPRCTFGAVTINGVDGQLADAITNRLAFDEGEPYSPAALEQTQRALYELGRFSTVRVARRDPPPETVASAEPAPAADPPALPSVIPVDITVALASRREVKLGGGFGYEPLTYEARVRAGGSLIPADQPLWRLVADARVAATVDHSFANPEPKIRIAGTALRTDLFRPRMVGEIGASLDYATVEAYTAKGPQVRLGLSSPLGVRWLTLRVGWALSYLDFDSIQVDELGKVSLGLDKPQRLGMFQQAVVADLRDDPINPTNGAYIALRVNEGTRFAGGALSFVQLTPDVRGYVALGTPRIVLAMKLRAGTFLGDVPVTERYYSGGAQNHRGFSERRLSPTLANTDNTSSVVIGGAAALETGAEVRVALGELWGLPIGTTLFLDGGEVTNDTEQLGKLGLHWAAGVGISAKLGGQIKVRIDVGHRLNRTGPDEPQYETGRLANTAFHFGVGDTF